MLLINIDIIDIFPKNIDMCRYVFLPIFPITNQNIVEYFYEKFARCNEAGLQLTHS